jgi:hypothetical protein
MWKQTLAQQGLSRQGKCYKLQYGLKFEGQYFLLLLISGQEIN